MQTNILYEGDCISICKSLPANSIDLCLTSPPYNTSMKYENYTDNLSVEDYYKWCEKWLREVYRLLKPDGRCAIVHYLNQSTGTHRHSPITKLLFIQEQIGFNFHAIALWTDPTRTKYTAWGSWLSASAPFINPSYEGILITYKDTWKKLSKGKSTMQKDDFVMGCSGLWNVGTARHPEHPAVFPDKLSSLVINLLSFENDVILDPFCGIGTSCLSASRLNRKFIGIDISKKYIDIAYNRIKGENYECKVQYLSN